MSISALVIDVEKLINQSYYPCTSLFSCSFTA